MHISPVIAMRLPQFGSPRSSTPHRLRSRTRKKHKRLDSICEKAFNQSRVLHTESNEGNVGGRSSGGYLELRRSSRVRRAPEVLDASPRPIKKRRKSDKNGEILKKTDASSVEKSGSKTSPFSNSGDLEDPGSWKSRLRSREKNLRIDEKEKGTSPNRKRRLFKDLDGFGEVPPLVGSEDDKREVFGGGKTTVVKSKRPGRIKASMFLKYGHEEIVSISGKGDDHGKNEDQVIEKKYKEDTLLSNVEIQVDNEVEAAKVSNEETGVEGKEDEMERVEKIIVEDALIPNSGVGGGNDEEAPNTANANIIDTVESEIPGVEEEGTGNVESTEQSDQPLAQIEHEREGESERELVESEEQTANQTEDEKASIMADKLSRGSNYKPRIKEGRRCGLCGGGAGGKPPKRLVHDMNDSDNDAYGSSSASEEPDYDLWDGFGDEDGWIGRLLGPINDRFGIAGTWVHQQCAVWSPEVYFAGLGCLKNVRAALCRGRALKCSRCGRPGATIGCRVDRCPKTYHLPCARAVGCIFDHRKFLIACTDHRHLFQPHGNQYIRQIKKMKVKKLKQELRKSSHDALRKDLDAEEKWLENCGEDEEFLKRESKRLHRDLLRIAPIYIGGSQSEHEKLFPGFESVAGLQNVVQCLKEVVILPLLYPEFFDKLGITPPRGVLLHGYPGTGKTLVVRALIGSCSRGDKRIAYFARKGADCLGKYVGDAERQLRLLFQVAEKSQPSIIFFDEIDGLAPIRTRQQDQTHSSVVSTLLALLDGLKSRGSVIVIGATNRPDSIDPALRRPGRFDREIYFPLPSVNDRADILSLHTRNWPKPVSGSLLKWIARRTVGFAGADLQALCTQAAILALKRNCPLHELLSASEKRNLDGKRFSLPSFSVEEIDWLEAISSAPPPCSRREAGMAANDVISSPLKTHLIPFLLQPLSMLLVSLYVDERLILPSPVSRAGKMIKDVVVTRLNEKKIPSDQWWCYAQELIQEPDVMTELEGKLPSTGLLVGETGFSLNNHVDDEDSYWKFEGFQMTGFQRNIINVSRTKLGFRVLIGGNPRCGQRYLASCILHCYAGNVEIRKVDLATILQEGYGDLEQGVARVLTKCASVGSCILYMPRIDLWAIEAPHHVAKEETDSHITNSEMKDASNLIDDDQLVQSASHSWSLFVEQVDSIYPSTSVIILATSEVPIQLLPLRVREFFKSNSSTSSLSCPSEHSIPRFSIHLDGNSNREMVIDSSVRELSRELIQQFSQLIHQRTHCHTIPCDNFKVCEASIVVGTTNKASGRKNVFPVNTRNLKAKSNLLLAISSFGYQILRYPHFAELCWFTSKLKEGPSADVHGPWKGWPFNSCIARPNRASTEKLAAGCKSKEKFGSVRGLIAVGLSAYRGGYASAREVSFEVRKVLELLVGQITARIEAGKDRYKFVRLLSQVAFLEDMVSSWAYALQSLEMDKPMISATTKLGSLGSSDNNIACVENIVQSEERKRDAANSLFQETETLAESPHRFRSGDDLNKVDDRCVQTSEAVKIMKGWKISDYSEPGETENPGNKTVFDRDFGSMKHSEEFSLTEPVVPSEDGVEISLSGDICNQITQSQNGKVKFDEHSKRISHPSAYSGVICFYHCCSKCLYTLHSLMQKVLLHKWESRGNCSNLEDVHDIVTSLSVDLVYSLGKFSVTEENSVHENSGNGKCGKKFGRQDTEDSQDGNTRNNLLVPMECSCHDIAAEGRLQPSVDLKYIYKDGVLTSINHDEDVSFHCKFENLCLCSLIELIVKQQLD